MKLSMLKSLGHNIADSVASGIGLLIGVYEMDVFAEAAASEEGHIIVNFLDGTSTGATPSSGLAQAIRQYRDALPSMCAKHAIDLAEIKVLSARFGTDAAYGPHFKVTVGNMSGRVSTDQYVGMPGRRLRKGRR